MGEPHTAQTRLEKLPFFPTRKSAYISLKPVVDLQAGDALKVAKIVGDHFQVPRQGNGSNLKVGKADRQPLPLQIRCNLAIDLGCLLIKRDHPT